jgi:exoribonuclease R
VAALPLRLQPSAASLAPGFDRIRAELRIPGSFPAAAESEALSARIAPGPRADRRDLDLLTIDPAGSRDLDQALAIARRAGGGYRVNYAIADVAAMVAPGGAVDTEARARGVTIYMPDRRVPLHPLALSEGSASLLPGSDRPALLWTIDLDSAGEAVSSTLERARVRSGRALGYAEAQAEIAAGRAGPTLGLLREVGLLRAGIEAARGGVSLTIPVQEVLRDGDGYALRYESPLPVEDWNAQISLLTGICAARIMTEGGLGLFRTLEPAEPRDLEALRRSALTLGVDWPEGVRYPDLVRSLDPSRPAHAAFAVRATRLFHGAGYAVWRRADGGAPPVHAAIASLYAHVTAPLRRLADRFANEIVLAHCAGVAPPAWAMNAVEQMPDIMAACGSRERRAERAAVDYVESALLSGRIGEVFPGTVVDVREGRATVQLTDPAVVAPLDGDGAVAGERVSVRLARADIQAREVRFTRA